jgi:2-amino-4-hydroxy-6-hydroxymethyldihydropteridine diphosphokinase
MSEKAVIGIGTNLGDKIENIRRAIEAIKLLPNTKVLALSHIYETKPMGITDQPNFFNAAISVETGLSPLALLGACLGIEAAMGRARAEKNGPRIIDLDLLIYDRVKSESFELTLPHPGILKRAFVMVPLLELFPNGRAPGLYFGPHLKESGCDGVSRLDIELKI